MNRNGLTNSSSVMAMLPHVFMITTRRAGNNSSAFGKELRSERGVIGVKTLARYVRERKGNLCVTELSK